MRDVCIGNLKIGKEFPVRIIGELGICHRGDVELAKQLATTCAEAGVDIIKFDLFLNKRCKFILDSTGEDLVPCNNQPCIRFGQRFNRKNTVCILGQFNGFI